MLYAAGVAPSLLIAWFGWRALQAPPAMGIEAATALAPLGQVRYRNDLWTARSAQPVKRGERVRIQAVEGLRLRVVPERR